MAILARKINFVASEEFLDENIGLEILSVPAEQQEESADESLPEDAKTDTQTDISKDNSASVNKPAAEDSPVIKNKPIPPVKPADAKKHTTADKRSTADETITKTTVAPSDEPAGYPANISLLPEYIKVLNATPALNRQEEYDLFRKYNYLKYLICKKRAEINLARIHSTKLLEIETYLEEVEKIKNTLAEANLRLVVSIAGRHTGSGTGFDDLLSKGHFALIKAVEEFDYTKGYRFSKFASLNIAKEFARVSGRSTELSRKKASSIADVQRALRTAASPEVSVIERDKQNLIATIKNELTEREQYVILNHFGLIGSGIKKQTKTLKDIGDRLNLSKERVRQIELAGLQKLRQCLSPEQFELLTG